MTKGKQHITLLVSHSGGGERGMRLYLIQHGEAVEKNADPARPLSDKGIRDVKKVGAFLTRLHLDVAEIRHSGKLRARQTAELLGPAMAPEGRIIEQDGLEPDAPVKTIMKAIEGVRHDIALVGHLPHLSRLAGALICGDAEGEPITFQKAGIVALERDADGGAWRVCWMVTPELLGK